MKKLRWIILFLFIAWIGVVAFISTSIAEFIIYFWFFLLQPLIYIGCLAIVLYVVYYWENRLFPPSH